MRDFPSVVQYVEKMHPDAPIAGVGHSFGAQLIGLNGEHRKLKRFLCIAGGTGYLKHTKFPFFLNLQLSMLHLASFVFRPQIPEFLSVGAKIPVGAFREWKRWSLSPKYMLSDPELADQEQFSKIKIPVRMLGFSDDPFATREAVHHLADWFSHSQKEIDWIESSPKEKMIGHMGFFKRENGELWHNQSTWLLAS